MATTTTTSRTLCDICKKTKGISKCEGCEKIFCHNHFTDHRQQLNLAMDEIEMYRDVCRQTLTEQRTDRQTDSLIQQIDEWERNAIEKVRTTANQAREMVQMQTMKYFANVESQLNEITKQLKQSREDNDFVETDFANWKEQLSHLTNDVNQPLNISLREDSKSIVNSIYIDTTVGMFINY